MVSFHTIGITVVNIKIRYTYGCMLCERLYTFLAMNGNV